MLIDRGILVLILIHFLTYLELIGDFFLLAVKFLSKYIFHLTIHILQVYLIHC